MRRKCEYRGKGCDWHGSAKHLTCVLHCPDAKTGAVGIDRYMWHNTISCGRACAGRGAFARFSARWKESLAGQPCSGSGSQRHGCGLFLGKTRTESQSGRKRREIRLAGGGAQDGDCGRSLGSGIAGFAAPAFCQAVPRSGVGQLRRRIGNWSYGDSEFRDSSPVKASKERMTIAHEPRAGRENG